MTDTADRWGPEVVPRLRDDLVVRRQGTRDKPGVIEDPTFRRRYGLDAPSWRVVHALDGQRTVDEVLRRVNLGRGGRVPRALLVKVLDFLDEAGLLVDPSASRQRAPVVQPGTVRLRADAVASWRVEPLPGARFTCQGSGMCCGGYVVGPVDDATAARLEAHAFAGDPPHLRGERFSWAEDASGRRIRSLRDIDGVCVFLDEQRRCRVHAELGHEAKPAACRAYPLELVAFPDRVLRVGLNMECGGMTQARFGLPLAEQVPAAVALAAEVPVEQLDDPVRVDAARTVPWADWRAVEAEALAGLDDTALPIAGHLRRLARVLLGGPEPEGPPVRELVPRAADVVQPVLERVLAWTGKVAKEDLDAGVLVRADLQARTRLAAALLLGRREVVGDLWDVASAHRRQLPGTRVGDPGEELLRLHLRHAIFLGRPHRSRTLAVGVGWLALQTALAGALAPVIAAHARRLAPDEAVVAEAIRTVNRSLRSSALAHVMADDDDLLARWATALAGENPGTD
ncbi:MAG: YkgJ family cysteine cluster protein [Alphaproteobacteria bacterium]|nr:YkgJ family cysteine cluster protein [Alphaproteobacteria bacterium]